MKYLGIDYGSRKIGISISDKNGSIAFPKEIVLNEGLFSSVEKIASIINKEEIEEVVVGHSANFQGKDNPIMRDVRQFVDSLKRETNITVHLEPEFLSSIQAARITGKTNKIDAQAAAIILQSFLNKIGN